MKRLYRRCAGLDIHKDSISVCIRMRVRGKAEAEVLESRFSTFTQELERLAAWLKEHKVRQVAMESTGLYWRRVWNVLDSYKYGLKLMLVNPAIVRALQRCKTDRIDARRIAEFLQYGLEADMEPHQELIQRLCTIPGIEKTTARVLISELGTDMSQFPNSAHAACWAGLCPGNSESAGKRFSGKTRKGDRYLRRILVQSAWAAARTKDCFFSALFYRVAQKRGMKKTALAVAHRLLTVAFLLTPSEVIPAEICSKCHKWRLGQCIHDQPRPKRVNKPRKPKESTT